VGHVASTESWTRLHFSQETLMEITTRETLE